MAPRIVVQKQTPDVPRLTGRQQNMSDVAVVNQSKIRMGQKLLIVHFGHFHSFHFQGHSGINLGANGCKY